MTISRISSEKTLAFDLRLSDVPPPPPTVAPCDASRRSAPAVATAAETRPDLVDYSRLGQI